MLEATKSKIKTAQNSVFITKLNIYLVSPLKAGLSGFAIFFTVLLLTKLIVFLVGSQPIFETDINDVYFSLIGFGLYFLIRLLENSNKKD